MKTIVYLLIFLIFIGGGFFSWFKISTGPKSAKLEFKSFVIAPGENLESIAKRLEKDGFIKNAFAFKLLATAQGFAKKIQAGSFQLSSSYTVANIVKELTIGTFDVWVTIPEGWRVEEIAEKLEKELGVEKSQFLKVAKEGYMFPDTYLIPKKATPPDIAKIMLDNFDKRFDQNLRNAATVAGLKLDQVIVLASIVEREVRFPQDRPIVAEILLKRGRLGLPLEADATVQYAFGFYQAEKSWWKKELTTDDLKINSPYNTRKFSGLPPGPICNPGLASVKSVINPAKTDYLYYLSDKEGKMHYAKTLEEHIENIRNYLKD